jgi:hypothetical protein
LYLAFSAINFFFFVKNFFFRLLSKNMQKCYHFKIPDEYERLIEYLNFKQLRIFEQKIILEK